MATSCLYGHLRPGSVHALEGYLAAIWMFAALFLFTSIGADINALAFASIQGETRYLWPVHNLAL